MLQMTYLYKYSFKQIACFIHRNCGVTERTLTISFAARTHLDKSPMEGGNNWKCLEAVFKCNIYIKSIGHLIGFIFNFFLVQLMYIHFFVQLNLNAALFFFVVQ